MTGHAALIEQARKGRHVCADEFGDERHAGCGACESAVLTALDAAVQQRDAAIAAIENAHRLIESAPCSNRCAWTTAGGECDCWRSRALAALAALSDVDGGDGRE